MGLFKELIEDARPLTAKFYDLISDYDVYSEFLGYDIDVKKTLHSPLRDGDDMPSFSFFIPTKKTYDREYIWWRDFAGGNGNMFDFVQKWAEYNEGIILNGRYEIIKYIDSKLNLNMFNSSGTQNIIRRKINYKKLKKTQPLLFKSRDFTIIDLWWWAKFGIDKELLERHNVRSVKYLLDEDFTIKYSNSMNDLMYAYIVYDKVKLYSPLSKYFKWKSNIPSEYIFGEEQLEDKDVMIITKSMKDIMSFKSFIDCDSISTQSETSFLPDDWITLIKLKYKYIYVVMDYDKTGIEAAEHYKSLGLQIKWISTDQVNIDGKMKPIDKDISDHIKNHTIKETFAKLHSIFNALPDKYFRDDRAEYLENLRENIL